jgi:alkanesulfonate monooxygenase SsuD/methylene tetrahydromethanopterin reductase-like flavin-dependent oxidoreductase (luciferase family)
MVTLEITFDLRVPKFSNQRTEDIYACAIDMCEWADAMNFQAVTIGEHHVTDDQYCASPLVFGALVGGRTRQLDLRPIILAPFYNPIRLAEDLATLNLATRGRALPVISAGYRTAEFDLYGLRSEDRVNVVVETVEVLRNAWSGKPFRYRGRSIGIVSPVPDPPPRLLMGAMTPMMARLAADHADGCAPGEARIYAHFAAERRRLGKPDPQPFPNQGTHFMYITNDPESAWDSLVPYWTHMIKVYTQWASEAGKPVNNKFPPATNKEELKRNPSASSTPSHWERTAN